MTADDAPGSVEVDSYTPKVLGILNVVFALALMACGLCQNFYAMLPSLMGFISDAQVQQEARKAVERTEQLAKLRADEKAAPEGDEREAIKARREALESEVEVKVAPPAVLTAPGLKDPRFLGHFLVDLMSNFILNLLLLISGIGLIFLRSWGRRLAVFVAWAKIVRLLLLAVSVTLVVAPFAAKVLSGMEKEMAAANPNVPPAPSVSASLGMGLTAVAWGMFLLGTIYPAISIWLLGRRSVRSSCESARPSASW